MTKTYDIIIGGGSIIGSVMALALAGSGLTIALIDQMTLGSKSQIKFDGRAYALSVTTIRMLSVLGIWSELAKTAQPIHDIKVSDGKAGEGASPFYMHFAHSDMEIGPIGYMVEDRFIRNTLLTQVLSNERISVFSGSPIIKHSFNHRNVEVLLKNKTLISGKLLIGSDGRRSAIGKQSGIKRNTYDYNQTSIVCAVSHERDHAGEAHQFFMPSGPLAILPLQNMISSIVWTEKNKKADQLKSLPDQDFLEELRNRFGNFRGKISLEGDRYFFPLSLSLSQSLIAQRLALIGDAAHALHPLAGQGLNLGMRDIASLAEIVTLARRQGEDFGATEVLTRYANWREFDRVTLSSITHLVNKVFSNDSIILKTFRRVSMGAINNNLNLRKILMMEASGSGAGLPVLMSGKRI